LTINNHLHVRKEERPSFEKRTAKLCFFSSLSSDFFQATKTKKKRKLTLSRNFYSKKDNPDLFFQPTPNQTKKRRRFIPTKHPTPRFHHHQGVVLVYVVVGGRN